MITKENLPASYEPFRQLAICSNLIIGGGHIVSVGSTLPIIVGQGPKPLIWLQAANDPEGKSFVTVVDASISKHPAIRVIEEGDEIKVTTNNTVVLRVKSKNSDSAIVEEIDLRPLGINIHGDSSKLIAGGMSFSSSTFRDAGTIIAFG